VGQQHEREQGTYLALMGGYALPSGEKNGMSSVKEAQDMKERLLFADELADKQRHDSRHVCLMLTHEAREIPSTIAWGCDLFSPLMMTDASRD
jgi:hypothetical protein